MNTEMVFDRSEPNIDMNSLHHQYWSYSICSSPGEKIRKALPSNMPQSLVNGFTIRCFVDAGHAGESLTRRLRTGFIIIMNNAPFY